MKRFEVLLLLFLVLFSLLIVPTPLLAQGGAAIGSSPDTTLPITSYWREGIILVMAALLLISERRNGELQRNLVNTSKEVKDLIPLPVADLLFSMNVKMMLQDAVKGMTDQLAKDIPGELDDIVLKHANDTFDKMLDAIWEDEDTAEGGAGEPVTGTMSSAAPQPVSNGTLG